MCFTSACSCVMADQRGSVTIAGFQPAGASPATPICQTCLCTRELGTPTSTEDTMANRLRDNGPTGRSFGPVSVPAPAHWSRAE